MSRAPPRGGDSALGFSLFARQRDGRTHARTDGRTEGRRETGEPHPGDENRKGRATRQRRPRAGEREWCDGALGAPETATERQEEEGGRREEGVRTPCPRPPRLARARQHGTVPPRYPPADSRPHGGGRPGARPAPRLPSRPSLSLALSVLSALGGAFDAVSRSPPAAATASAARPRRGRAPPQRLAPGAGSYGALPESAFRGTKALRGDRDDDDDDRDDDARRAAGRAAPLSLAPRTRGRAPGFDRTSTQRNGRGKKEIGEAHAPKDRQEAGEPAPPTASPREGRRRPHMPSFGGGPGARARPGLRAEGHAARAGHAGGTAARPLSLSRDDAHTHTHTRLGPHAAGGAAVGPRTRRLPFGPLHRGARGAPPRRRAAGSLSSTAASPRSRRHATTAVPPARLPARRDRSRRAGQRPGGRAPPPAPEADATETRAGVASARGLPDGRPRRRRGRTPGAAAAASHRRGPLPRHAPGGRRTALSRGATPALLVFTRRPGGGSAPAAARTPSYGPHAAGKGDGGRDVQGPGRDRRRRRRAPSGRPSPLGGTPVERRRRRSARGRPRSRASADGGPAGRSPPGRAGDRAWGGRPADGAAGAFEEERPPRGEGPDARDAAPRARETPRQAGRGESAAGPGGRNPAAEERQRAGALCRRRPLRRGERVGPRGRPRAAASPPRPGRGEGGAGRPSPARRGYPRARVRRGRRRRRPRRRELGRRPRTPPQGLGGSSCSPPLSGAAPPPGDNRRRRRRRRRHRRRHGGPRRAARVFKPPPGSPAPFRHPRSGVWRRRGGKPGGEPPRRGALGTWPWGEGNDLHGPAGVPPPLPPSGERPPAGARPPSAATTAASFSGPGVSLSSPALRPRGPPRLGPPRRRGDAARPPSAPRPRACARPEARPGTPGGLGPRPREGHRSARERELRRRGKAPLPGAGRAGGAASSEPRRRPRHLLPRHFHIGRRRVPRPDGRPSLDGRSSEGRDGRASGRGPAEHPSLPAPGRLSRALRGEPASGELGPPPAGRPHATPGDRRSAAPAAVGGRLGAGRGPAPRRGRTGGRPARGGGEEEEEEEEEEESRRDGGPARRASRPGRDARCSAGSAPPARTVTGARGAPGRAERPPPPPSARSSLSPEIPPRPEGSARLRHSLSGAAARGLDGKGVWPPRCRPRPAGRGAERSNGAGVRATPRARPAGRPGNAAGAEPHR
ncbi:collagen alpha-1(I) chain-like [Melospiza melodia melodia]|uniref:collagen alpha-1(I) chain-like n=1 Tax=Melospiza melodia melodia TaxID=1914991 RepID=UPI002FD2C345